MKMELLAMLFAMTKFHQYVFDAQVIPQPDHEPLETIFTKPIGKTPKIKATWIYLIC